MRDINMKSENDKLSISWNRFDNSKIRKIMDKIYDEVIDDNKIDLLQIDNVRDKTHDFNIVLKEGYIDLSDEENLKNSLRKVRHLIKHLNLPSKPKKVKIRKRGVTSCGLPNDCHFNVLYFVKKYGGKRVLGYSLESEHISNRENKYGVFSEDDIMHGIFHHSVWETPEGNLVDVTCKGYSDGTDRDVTYFFPLSTHDPSVVYKNLGISFACYDDANRGVEINEYDEKLHQMSWSEFKRQRDVSSQLLHSWNLNYYKTGQYQDWVNLVLMFQSELGITA